MTGNEVAGVATGRLRAGDRGDGSELACLEEALFPGPAD